MLAIQATREDRVLKVKEEQTRRENVALERGMCLIPHKNIWPALSRSKDPRVFNAQERSWKERPSLTRF